MLQEEECSEIGWFLWSARNMDAGALADEIGDTRWGIMTSYDVTKKHS